MKVRVRQAPQLRCPYCHDAVEVDRARICPACASAQHVACDLAHGGCAVCVVYAKPTRSAQSGPWRRSRFRGLNGELRRRQEVLTRAKNYGLGALALFLATIVAVCLVPLSYPSEWTLLAALLCLVCAGGTVVSLGIGLSSLCRAYWGSRW